MRMTSETGVLAVALRGLKSWFRDQAPTPRAFVSFAAEDARIRDLFVGQAKNKATPWRFEDASIHEPFSEQWKTHMRNRIRRCDVVIQLVGQFTYRAEGALWEVRCAHDEGIPAFGIWISRKGRHKLPACFSAGDVIPWTWGGIRRRMDAATRRKRSRD